MARPGACLVPFLVVVPGFLPFPAPGAFLDSLIPMCRESNALVVRNIPFSTGCFFIISSGSSPNTRAGSSGNMVISGRSSKHMIRPSKGWAEMIRKVYEVDPMVCSSATMMSPADPSHANFFFLDFEPRSGISSFHGRRRRCQAYGEIIADNLEKEITKTLKKEVRREEELSKILGGGSFIRSA